MSRIYGLNKGFGFRKIDDDTVEITTDPKDKTLIMSSTPRVMVHSDGDDKSATVTNVRVEFATWHFPLRYFNLHEDGTLSIQCKRYTFKGDDKPWTKLEIGNV